MPPADEPQVKRARGVNGLPTRTVLVFSSATLAAARELGPDSDATAAGTDAQQLSVDEGSPRLTGRRSSRKRASWLPGNGQAVRGGALKQGGAAKKAAVAVAAEAAPVCDTGPSDTGGSLAEPASHALATPRGGSSRPGGGSAAVSLPRGVPRVSVGAPADGLLLPSDDAVPLSPSLSLAAAAAPDGLHYFPDDATSCGALVLPRNRRQGKHVTDEQLLAAASTDGAVNCVPGCEHYVVVRTTPDGNCLSHACSLGVWGYHDHDAELRRAVCATMGAPVVGGAIRKRFCAALQRIGIPPDQWDIEWRHEMDAFAGSLRGGRGRSRAFLSDVHCFVLANVLRRPLVIYGGAMALAAGLAGVYLPLLWTNAQGPPCSRVPTSLLFHKSHFSVLATVERDSDAPPNARGPAMTPTRSRAKATAVAASAKQGGSSTRLPLAVMLNGSVVPLPVRFLLPQEEARAAELLRTWMDIVPDSAARAAGVPSGILVFTLPKDTVTADCVLRAVEATVAAQTGEHRGNNNS